VRRVLIGAALAVSLLVFLASAAATATRAAAAEPIVGTWDSAGAQVRVDELGPNRFQGTVVSGSFANCPNLTGPGTVIWKQVGGGGFGYDGKIPWVHLPDCTPLGDGNTTFALSSINSGSLTSTSPDGSKTESASMTRVGNWDVTAWVQNILNGVVKPTYDPCVAGDVAAGKSDADCGQKGLRSKEQFWKANGSVICATGTVLSGSGKGTIVTTPTAVNDCVQSFPPPKRVRGRLDAGASHRALARIKAGTYKGFSASLARPDQNPKKKQLRRRARALGKFLASHKKPGKANPISFKVGKGRATTFSATLTLTCEDGSSLPVALNDLPDPTAPLTVPKKGYFRLGAEGDPLVTARIGGDFLAKRKVAGTLYVAVHFHQHGVCESWVGFAARKG
jgi:hypothetical protein